MFTKKSMSEQGKLKLEELAPLRLVQYIWVQPVQSIIVQYGQIKKAMTRTRDLGFFSENSSLELSKNKYSEASTI